MKSKQHQLKELIQSWESGHKDLEALLHEIQQLTGEEVDPFILHTYSGAMDLEELCEELAMEPIHDWREIDDTQAMALIQEVLDSETKPAIRHRNEEALERRYDKPSGFVSGLVFEQDMDDPAEILEELMRDTVIRL